CHHLRGGQTVSSTPCPFTLAHLNGGCQSRFGTLSLDRDRDEDENVMCSLAIVCPRRAGRNPFGRPGMPERGFPVKRLVGAVAEPMSPVSGSMPAVAVRDQSGPRPPGALPPATAAGEPPSRLRGVVTLRVDGRPICDYRTNSV